MQTRITARSIASMVMATAVFFIAERGVVADDRGGYESEQGTRIFGTRDKALEGVQIPYEPKQGTQQSGYQRLSIEAGQLNKWLKNGTKSAGVVGAELVGTKVTAEGGKSSTAKFVIVGAHPHVNMYNGETSSTVWEYHVMVRDDAKVSPLCDNARNAALVVPGDWNEKGTLLRVETWFTFSCVPTTIKQSFADNAEQPKHLEGLLSTKVRYRLWRGGAAAKCIDYGYAPWVGGVSVLGKTTKTGQKLPAPSQAAARRFHNLCTRVMTADYGGTGQSHTLPGTVIRIFNLANLPVESCTVGSPTCPGWQPGQISPVSSTTEKFELHQGAVELEITVPKVEVEQRCLPKAPSSSRAASHPDGTAAKSSVVQIAARQHDGLQYEGAWGVDRCGNVRALCLAKPRWETIDALDPQFAPIHMSMGSNTWTYCEDGVLAELDDYETVLVSYSAILERGLYRFSQGGASSKKWITTSHVRSTSHGIEVDPNFILCTGQCKLEKFEGNILSPELPWDLVHKLGVKRLYLYKDDDGNYRTDINEDGSDSKDLQGYVFNHAPNLPPPEFLGCTAARAPGLVLWKRQKRYCTTTDKCDGYDEGSSPLGFTLSPETAIISRIFPKLSYCPISKDLDILDLVELLQKIEFNIAVH